jgi:UDP-N-acetylglucosamine--N-acetylmuramyl-(pentapeptide) pyrophosphoryl-undecaprenol N-acetylglucosamine transferase
VDAVREAYQRAGLDARVEPFLYDMHREMHAADLVVCRSGATTLAELAACGKPAILVPLPTATDDHQRANAAAVVASGAAIAVEQSVLAGAGLAAEIVALVGDAPRLAQMAEAASRLAKPDAARSIAARVLELSGVRA